MDPIILILFLLPSLLFLGSFVIAKRISGTSLRAADPTVVVWGVLGGLVMTQWPNVFQDALGWSPPPNSLLYAFLWIFPPSLITAALLGASMRSWLVVVYSVIAGAVTPVVAVSMPELGLAGMLVWNVIVGAGMVTWANGERHARRSKMHSSGLQ